MLNSTGAVRSQRRKSSRTNSTSSSVVTVKKAASISSRSGSRPPHSATRPRSPDELGPQLTALLQSSFDPSARHRRSSSWSRPGSSAEVNQGVGNLNRWSHSTSSSTSGQEGGQGRKRKNSSSKHTSIGSPSVSVASSLDASQISQVTDARPGSRKAVNEQLSRRDVPVMNPKLKLLPITDLGVLKGPTTPQGTPSSTSGTPLTAELLTPSTAPNDYFGEQWNFGHRTSSQVQGSVRPAKIAESPRAQKVGRRYAQPEHNLATKPMPPLPVGSTSPEADRRQGGWMVGHSRSFGQEKVGNGNAEPGSSISSNDSDRERLQQRRTPAQKTMLSQALAKANSAVLLDNDQDFGAAIDAYQDACRLLRQVMVRSSGDEDKQKLQAIRTTYTNRIGELLELEQSFARSQDGIEHYDSSNENLVGVSSVDDDHNLDINTPTNGYHSEDFPPRRQSLLPFHADVLPEINISVPLQEEFRISHDVPGRDIGGSFLSIDDSMKAEYMPPPLSPKKTYTQSPGPHGGSAPPSSPVNRDPHASQPARPLSGETTSWLNTIDESGGSSTSSINSRNSSIAHGANAAPYLADPAEAEFNFALSAAVDAAYTDVLDDVDQVERVVSVDVISTARRNVELAKEMVREVERESEREATATEQSRRVTPSPREPMEHLPASKVEADDDDHITSEYLDEEAEEEERLLEEMTRGYIMDDFVFNIQTKSALPRTSDSSSFSGRTHGSSVGSTTITTGTSLSTLAEVLPPTTKQKLPPPHPPPAAALPIPPIPGAAPPPVPTVHPLTQMKPSAPRPLSFDKPLGGLGVRDRRLSGQNARQLKIDTNQRRFSGASATKPQQPILPVASILSASEDESISESAANDTLSATLAAAVKLPDTMPSTPMPSVHSIDSTQTDSPTTPALTFVGSQTSDDGITQVPPSPTRFHIKPMPPPPTVLRKNFSSSSLTMRNLSVTTAEGSDMSPITPASASFPLTREATREASMPLQSMHTAGASSFTSHGAVEGSLYLFDDSIHMPQTPGTPGGSDKPNAPMPLEPCPDSFLLRPFWLMRCLYQTVAHPRGGYLSTKLFIPRDIWRVKNVKLKAVDDKVSQCDLLTAALLKLGRVDTLDADAVLEEMQSFEMILEQVRINLQKKLGNEVGLSGSAGLLKSSPASEEPQADALAAKSSNMPGKSYLASWRKLRSKSSGAGINATYASLPAKESSRDVLTMPSLPMTATPSSRPHRKLVQKLQNTGPNANYMGALARLFDAVQVLDQIARQVEDPGLKCSSKTHVGLELCTRNAAEFFGFYICRFALTDIGLMLDKFIKRGSEWVLV